MKNAAAVRAVSPTRPSRSRRTMCSTRSCWSGSGRSGDAPSSGGRRTGRWCRRLEAVATPTSKSAVSRRFARFAVEGAGRQAGDYARSVSRSIRGVSRTGLSLGPPFGHRLIRNADLAAKVRSAAGRRRAPSQSQLAADEHPSRRRTWSRTAPSAPWS
jgi:hypothetical protein